MRNSKIKLLFRPFSLSFTSMSSPNTFLGIGSFEVNNSSMSNSIDFYNIANGAFTKLQPNLNSNAEDSFFNLKFPITSCKFAPNPACESTDFILTASDKVRLYSISPLTSSNNDNKNNQKNYNINNEDKIKSKFMPNSDSNNITTYNNNSNPNDKTKVNINDYDDDSKEMSKNKYDINENMGKYTEEANIKLQSTYPINKTNHPITSLDWNRVSRTTALVSSTDNSVSLIDVVQCSIASRVMAHDSPVHDVTFCDGVNTFVTAGFDGSLRLFDLRDLRTLLVLYQAAMPLLRTCVCPTDNNWIALFGRSATGVTLVDARMPGVPSAASTHVDKEVCGIAWSLVDDAVLFSINTDGQLRACNFAAGKTMAPNQVIYNTHCRNEAIAVTGNCVAIAYKKKVEVVPIIGEELFIEESGISD